MQSEALSNPPAESRNVFKTPFSAQYWRLAVAQLKDVKILCIAAILIALRVVLKSLAIPVGENLNIMLGFFVNALGAMIFGPVVAIIGAAISDTLGALLFPGGVYYFPFIFPEIAGSFIFALFLWRTKLSSTRIILSRFVVSLVCNIILNPIIMISYYQWLNDGKIHKVVILPRVIKNLALFPAESFLLVLFLGALIPSLTKLKLIPKTQDKPVFSKRHAVLLAGLFTVAVICVALFYFVYLPNK